MVSWESSLNKKNMSDPVSRNLARGWHPWDSHDRQPAFQLFRSRSHIRQVTYLRSASVWPKVTRCYKPFRGKKQKQPVLVTCRCFFYAFVYPERPKTSWLRVLLEQPRSLCLTPHHGRCVTCFRFGVSGMRDHGNPPHWVHGFMVLVKMLWFIMLIRMVWMVYGLWCFMITQNRSK